MDAAATIDGPGYEASCAPESETPVTCTATTTTVLTSGYYPQVDQVAVDNAYVYFDALGVWRVSKTGGTPSLVASPTEQGWPVTDVFTLDDVYVSWLTYTLGTATTSPLTTVMRAPKQGCAAGTLTALSGPFSNGLTLVPSSDDLYVYSGGDGPAPAFYRVSALGAVITLPPTPWLVMSLAQSDDGVIYATTELVIYRLDGTSYVPFVSSNDYHVQFAGPLRFDANNVYFITYDPFDDAASIAAVPKAGGPTTIIASAAGTLGFGDFTLDGAGHIYATQREPNNVLRINVDGSGATIVGSGTSEEQGIGVAVDDVCVYWGSSGGVDDYANHVYAAPK